MSSQRRRVLGAVAGVAFVAVGAVGWVFRGGHAEATGPVNPARPPETAVAARLVRQISPDGSAAVDAAKQILFGDLHVHTTFSVDAFMRSLPLMGGEGAHPANDACDFARFCSQLEFFAITDHAESLTPRFWRETKDAVRQCNRVAGDPAAPDVVAFTGWEWSQVGATPEEHWGHKNVIFRDTAEDRLPKRPIAASGLGSALRRRVTHPGPLTLLSVPFLELSRRQRYLDLAATMREITSVPVCPPGVDTRSLAEDCREQAATPGELFEKLGQWGFDALVIPHGTTWGFYTPAGYTWDKQLSAAEDDPERQRLIEIYSGHGNSEEYRTFREGHLGPDGEPVCPEPTSEFEACCHRAGELIRARCHDVSSEECERRVDKARADYVLAGVGGHLTVPGATVEDWKDCGQCRDCFNPSFSYRPGGSAQYALARGDFADPTAPRHATLGFIASSDNHTARPGTGYKEVARRKMGEATGQISPAWRGRVGPRLYGPTPESRSLSREELTARPPFEVVHVERQASFFMTGGLVAVHSEGRSREAIWDALDRREVYGTSGERILLWFDLVNAPGDRAPMGAEVALSEAPRFEVRAAGSFVQKPGCPEWVSDRIGADELARLCVGECYHPSDERHRITRIEVVRIRPQVREDEPVEALIDDPWRTIDCPESRAGCRVTFQDDEFPLGARDVTYYVRAIQEPTPAVNAGGLRCERDERGQCVSLRPCYGDYRTSFEDDCLSDNEERAWSSPIFVRFAGSER